MIVVVTGTGTDVGKTYVAAAVARALRAAGVAVAARKPVQSYTPGDAKTDADVLAAATGEPVDEVCPPSRRLPLAMAPPMAADALGRPRFSIAELIAAVRLPGDGITLVEGAGGLRSPLADDGDTNTLIEHLSPALVVLVADAGLGTINAVRLSVEALGTRPTVVFLNRYDNDDGLHGANRDWLATRAGLDVVTDVETLVARIVNRISC